MRIEELNFDMERILEDLERTVNDGFPYFVGPGLRLLGVSPEKTYSRPSLFNGVIRQDCLSIMYGARFEKSEKITINSNDKGKKGSMTL
jgi:hypothetical protein